MHSYPVPLVEALAEYDRASAASALAEAEAQRNAVLAKFPLTRWATLPIEEYALGQDAYPKSFCWFLEKGTQALGLIAVRSAKDYQIFYQRKELGWFHQPQYKDERAAWEALRGAFMRSFELARSESWDAIDGILELDGAVAVRLKTLHLYFPEDILPISSPVHLRYYLQLLGRNPKEIPASHVVRLNRALIAALREIPQLHTFSTKELEHFLYQWADPRRFATVVKISTGEGGEHWKEFQAGGYICVGWEKIGDLNEFATVDALRETFRKHYPKFSQSSELWRMHELAPGNIVVACQGASKVKAIGVVTAPGYEYRQDRPAYRHMVHVHWDTRYAQDIEPQKRWGLDIVANVPLEVFADILGEPQRRELKTAPTHVPQPRGTMNPTAPANLDPLYTEIASALERKGQAILYGPPGTGKTFAARRFAVWWLLKNEGRSDAAAVLVDRKKLEAEERRLTTAQTARRVWWVVTNPKEWSWDNLFRDGRVDYPYGRLRHNYPLVQPNDLVVGYQSTPDRRIMALAKVASGLGGRRPATEPTIELTPLARVESGLTFEELSADPILSQSEPMRFRNQGTLFALTTDEASHLLALHCEREPALQPHVDLEAEVQALTRLTFHPSYSYEDFVEGFRPIADGAGTLRLKLDDGIWKRICREAQAEPQRKYLVLIDEINRANLAKVFGEMITLLERDKRGLTITLSQSKDSFCVPSNVYLLGTMNTADRSIKQLDVALRRRFAFIELMPQPELFTDKKVNELSLGAFLRGLNDRIAEHEGREKQIGHSYLLEDDKPIVDPRKFAQHFRQDILPLLQEYCYEDYSTLAKYLGPKLVVNKREVNHALLNAPDGLVSALAEQFNAPAPTPGK